MKKLLTPNSPEDQFSRKIMNPAIIKPVRISIIGVALIIMLAILIFFSLNH